MEWLWDYRQLSQGKKVKSQETEAGCVCMCLQGASLTVVHSARSHNSTVSHSSTTKVERKASGVMSRILEGIFGTPEDSEVVKVLPPVPRLPAPSLFSNCSEALLSDSASCTHYQQLLRTLFFLNGYRHCSRCSGHALHKRNSFMLR
jgi:hypothetical protein